MTKVMRATRASIKLLSIVTVVFGIMRLSGSAEEPLPDRAKIAILLPLLQISSATQTFAEGNLIKNPGFEEGAKEWSTASVRNEGGTARVDIDKGGYHSGRASARLTLDFKENAQIYTPTQTVKVFPDTEYFLSAFIKTELESGSIHLEVQDARGWQALLVTTRALSGYNDWTKVEVSFRSTLSTEALVIGLRHVGRVADQQPMKGAVWLDDVTLVEKQPGRPRLTKEQLEMAIRSSRLITLENDAVRITFSEPRLRVHSFQFKKRPELMLSPGFLPEVPLYVIKLTSGEEESEEIRSLDAQAVQCQQESRHSYRIQASHAGSISTVSVRVRLYDSGFLDMQLLPAQPKAGWAIREIRFPQVATRGLLSDDPKDNFVSSIFGQKPVSLGKGWGWGFGAGVYPIAARIPLLYQYGKNGGVYLMLLDSEQWVKRLQMEPYLEKGQGLPTSIAWRCVVEMAVGDEVPKYSARLGLIEHSPYEAAEVYRNWASKQARYPAPLSKRKDIASGRARGVPHYFIYLPESGPNLLPKHPNDMTEKERAEHSQKLGACGFRLHEVPMVMESLPQEIIELGGVVDLRGWEKWGLWKNPDWWPPRQGEKALRDAIDAIHKAGWHVTADVMFDELSIHLPKEKHGFAEAGMAALEALGIVVEDVAIKDEQGNVPIYGPAPYEANMVCPSTELALTAPAKTIAKMIAAGFDDVQFDGGGSSIQLPCWNAKHAHPPGAGYWQTRVARDFYERLRTVTPDAPQVRFGFIEEYFNELRLRSYAAVYTRCEQSTEVVPRVERMEAGDKMAPLPSMFSFVYHGRMIETGFFEPGRQGAYMVAAHIAFGVCGGPQPTPWLTFRDILNEPWVKIFIAGTQARQTFARKYLLLGQMLLPVATEPWTTLKIGLKDNQTGQWRTREVKVPAIVQQAYRSPDGKIGWVLVNHTDERVTCIAQPPLPSWFSELSSSKTLRRVSLRATKPLISSDLKGFDLEPAEVVLIEQK